MRYNQRPRNQQLKLGRNTSGPKLPPQGNPWWWHPAQPGVASGPAWMERKLEEVDPDLRITRNGFNGNWQIWLKTPRNARGYTFLFPIPPDQLGDGTLAIARLYEASAARWGDGKKYMDAVIREQLREKEQAEKADFQDTMDRSMDAWDHSRIRVGYGRSSGSKFTDYHS